MTSDPSDTGSADDGHPEVAAPEADPRPRRPVSGQIAHVTGRKAKGGGPGLPAVEELVLHNDDGSVLEFGAPTSGEAGTLTGLVEIPDGVFSTDGKPTCPICLEGAGTEREHVPQEALGGHRMTRTCKPCNNQLGSKVEVDLENWFDHALTKVAMDHDGEVPGKRHLPTIYYGKAKHSDEFMLFPAGGYPDEVVQMMESGEFRLHYRMPDPRRWGLGLLKHAYLAACLHLRSVPDTADARAIRADLIAARDTPTKTRPPESEAAQRLKVYRSHAGKQGPPLALVAREPDDDDSEPEVLISLAGVLFVTWPFTDLPPGTWQLADADAE